MKHTREKREKLKSELSAAEIVVAKLARPNLERKARVRNAKAARIIAYDFETTRIQVGTPQPLYLTAYSRDFHFAEAIRSLDHLRLILRNHFLTEDRRGTKFVAWNGNRFDAYFVAAALITDPDFRLRPYLTKSNTLRGLRVVRASDSDSPNLKSWEFLDGMAMLGLAGISLEKLLANFAPDHRKQVGVIDFEREEFDPNNPAHCDYAMTDSIGLFHAMDRAQQIMLQTFNEPLRVTMGGTCIRIFQAHIPTGIVIHNLDSNIERIVSEFVMRGGFCYCAKRYHGPIWKYDINQAYAAAMRDAKLPAGTMVHGRGRPPKGLCSIIRITARKSFNKIPFYYRHEDEAGRLHSLFAINEIRDTWITSIEFEQLRRERWTIDVIEWFAWAESFNMREFVDKLETLRRNAPGGPSGPVGTMVKATGNHSYGKTVERIAPIEFLLASEQPPGFVPYYGDGLDPLEFVWYRIDEQQRAKAWHKPQIGAFITAHVRMVLRRAALLAPDAWLYADTDCVIFSRDVTDRLPIDPIRYGAWKIEESGTVYRIIAKKVYAEDTDEAPKRSSKGLNVRRLTGDDFVQWFEGNPPTQEQIQLQTFLSVLCGAEMYRSQTRRGTRIEAATASAAKV